ncbi:MAG TPA: DUF4157 domain-containing protein [Polyangia bacterium]|jgi:hypothetical protein|nr:DUF4157 domain-containing protein [Polyangia bacterium]
MSERDQHRSDKGSPPRATSEEQSSGPLHLLADRYGAAGVQRFLQHRMAQQRKQSAAQMHEAAARGTSGGGGALPHLERIQRAFGSHDVSHVQAHADGAAEAGARAMGARAFAVGDHVAFDGAPDLHTAAHEAAHVVQQRGGVQLKGGVGESGDAHERHADAVADAVVAGESAEPLLDGVARGGGGGASNAASAVQHKLRYEKETSWLNASANEAVGAKFSVLADIEKEADELTGGADITISAGAPAAGGAAHFNFKDQQVVIKGMPKESEEAIKTLSGAEVNDRAIGLSHELRHVCDAFQKGDKKLRDGVRKADPWEDLIHSEWRAHATQAKQTMEVEDKKGEVPSRHDALVKSWNEKTFDISQRDAPQSMFAITTSYIWRYSEKEPTDKQVQSFIEQHQDWVKEAFALCPPRQVGAKKDKDHDDKKEAARQ